MDPKLCELTPATANKVAKVLDYLKARGWQPVIAEAFRTKEQQQAKVDAGYSKTMNSKHRKRLAADIVDARYGWSGKCPKKFWVHLGMAAQRYGLKWGGLFGLAKYAKARLKALFVKGQTAEALKERLGWDLAHVESM